MGGDTHNLLGGGQESQTYSYNILNSAPYTAITRICTAASVPKHSTLLHLR